MPFALNDIKESFLYTLFRPSTPKEFYKMTFIEHNYTFVEYFDMFYDILYENSLRGSFMQIFDPRQNMSKNDFEIFHYKDAKFSGVPVH